MEANKIYRSYGFYLSFTCQSPVNHLSITCQRTAGRIKSYPPLTFPSATSKQEVRPRAKWVRRQWRLITAVIHRVPSCKNVGEVSQSRVDGTEVTSRTIKLNSLSSFTTICQSIPTFTFTKESSCLFNVFNVFSSRHWHFKTLRSQPVPGRNPSPWPSQWESQWGVKDGGQSMNTPNTQGHGRGQSMNTPNVRGHGREVNPWTTYYTGSWGSNRQAGHKHQYFPVIFIQRSTWVYVLFMAMSLKSKTIIKLKTVESSVILRQIDFYKRNKWMICLGRTIKRFCCHKIFAVFFKVPVEPPNHFHKVCLFVAII